MFLLLYYSLVQLATTIIAFISINGFDAITNEDSQANAQATFKDKQSLMLGVTVLILQLIIVVVRLLFPKAIFECSVHFMLQFVDAKLFEDKLDPLKIKVNYPLFLKKSKSNMFQKAMKEDFESQKMKDPTKTAKQETYSKFQITKKKIKKEKEKAAAAENKDRNLISGGFYSSRGAMPSGEAAAGALQMANLPENKESEQGQLPPVVTQSARSLISNQGEGPIDVQKKAKSSLVNRILQKKVDPENPAEPGLPSTRRDRFSMTQMTEREATERFKSTERTGNEPEEENLCFICFTNPPNAVFLDCGHGGRILLTN